MVEWLQAAFAEVSPEPVEEGEPSELVELRTEMMKNKKRIKSIVAMLEAQNKLLRRLAVTIDPMFHLPDVAEGRWGPDGVDSGLKASTSTEEENEEARGETSEDMATVQT